MTLLLLLQGEVLVPKISRTVSDVQRWRLDSDIFKEVLASREVELVCFCLMGNHYHLILSEIKEGGISRYMMRLGDSYTKYFNIIHERKGHLFESKFQSIHIDENNYLRHLSAYIHLNPHELKSWGGREHEYPWSSFRNYCGDVRLGDFINPSIVIDQYKDPIEYMWFVKETQRKDDLPEEYRID